jgi:hypothetical protein
MLKNSRREVTVVLDGESLVLHPDTATTLRRMGDAVNPELFNVYE